MDNNVSENLRRLREDHSLTQEALARELGVTEIAVYKWEAGRLPVEYPMLVKIADYFGIPADALLADRPDSKAKPKAADKITYNCRICGGDLVYNYSDMNCKCANCGNKWTISELYPKYEKVISTIRRAGEILNTKTNLSSADEARVLVRQAMNECSGNSDIVSSELVKICNSVLSETDKHDIYCKGKHFLDMKAYGSAIKELEKVRGYKDSDDLISRCGKRT